MLLWGLTGQIYCLTGLSCFCLCFALQCHWHMRNAAVTSPAPNFCRKVIQSFSVSHHWNVVVSAQRCPTPVVCMHQALHASFIRWHMLQEPSLLRNAIAFYRLLATWLMRMAFPPLTQGQMPFVPLPDPIPVQFRCLPVRAHPCRGCTPLYLYI